MHSNLEDVVASQESDRCSSCSSLCNVIKAIDGLSNDKAARFFDEESEYATLVQ